MFRGALYSSISGLVDRQSMSSCSRADSSADCISTSCISTFVSELLT